MELKVGTFNLYNLVLPEHEYYGNKKYSQQNFDKKIDWIANQLKTMDCDVVGFQEVFHKEALEQAIDKSGLYNGVEPLVIGETGESPVVGLVSKYPVKASESIVQFPGESIIIPDQDGDIKNEFSRPVLKATIELPVNDDVVMFVAHLKSKRPLVDQDKRDDLKAQALGKAKSLFIRASEATALRFILIDEMKDTKTPVIVLGDLNDSAQSVTSDILAGSAPWKKLPFDKKKQRWDQLLYSTYGLQARKSDRDVYYTHLYNGFHESLDHILVSEEFYTRNPDKIGVVQYMRVLNDHLVDETIRDVEIPKWQSDHAQVMVSIKLD